MEIICPDCHFRFKIASANRDPLFCPFCKASLMVHTKHEESSKIEPSSPQLESLSKHPQNQFSIGSYRIIRSIGKGGMGEVFLAHDSTCGRNIALKCIRPDLRVHQQLYSRFLREARITSQLTHPAIIPIYAIADEKDSAYYTMPFVEGKTLKDILTEARQQEIKGAHLDHLYSIPALTRIFLSVCQAIAYAHSKGVIHRDIKPTNIIVGQFGEVLILDWGLAKHIHYEESNEDIELATKDHAELTRLGKVVGTLTYMAPERALGQPASFQTDVYSLGVMLFQILTLRSPFLRKNLKEFRKNAGKETIIDPIEVAPYRDVPPILSRIAMKGLQSTPQDRYQTVQEMINDLEIYLEGRSDWFKMSDLNVTKKEDWEFQENVLMLPHRAIIRATEASEWVSLMISKASYPDNIMLETKVRIGNNGKGIGFLLSVPEASERAHLNSGYCLWIASDLNPSTKLLRSDVEVVSAPEIFLKRGVDYDIRIRKIDDNIYFYINDVLQFSYVSHMPLSGKQIGLLARDADYTLDKLAIFAGGQSIKVNCLAVPDSFLAHKQYKTALIEYRRIGETFPGTAEGREAKFRAGMTLLEEANTIQDASEKMHKYNEALEEFNRLHHTSGAPLQYLGKALVYQSMQEYEEEIKCFELAYRRYPRHPLLPIVQEQHIYRMYESARYHRKTAYEFILLALRHLPSSAITGHIKTIFSSLQKHWEPLPFLFTTREKEASFIVQLAFWLNKPYIIVEMIQELLDRPKVPLDTVYNALFTLIKLDALEAFDSCLKSIQAVDKIKDDPDFTWILEAYQSSTDLPASLQSIISKLPKRITLHHVRVLVHFLEKAIASNQTQLVYKLTDFLKEFTLDDEDRLQIDFYLIWALLLDKKWDAVAEHLHQYSILTLTNETSPLHFLYGIWLYVTKGKEKSLEHFSSLLDVPYPRSWTLFSHFINRKNELLQRWLQQAFSFEKQQFYKQCFLFYHCIGDDEKQKYYKNLIE